MDLNMEMFKLKYENANKNIITVMENQVQADIGCTRKEANAIVNHILDINDEFQRYKEMEEKASHYTPLWYLWEFIRSVKDGYLELIESYKDNESIYSLKGDLEKISTPGEWINSESVKYLHDNMHKIEARGGDNAMGEQHSNCGTDWQVGYFLYYYNDDAYDVCFENSGNSEEAKILKDLCKKEA